MFCGSFAFKSFASIPFALCLVNQYKFWEQQSLYVGRYLPRAHPYSHQSLSLEQLFLFRRFEKGLGPTFPAQFSNLNYSTTSSSCIRRTTRAIPSEGEIIMFNTLYTYTVKICLKSESFRVVVLISSFILNRVCL